MTATLPIERLDTEVVTILKRLTPSQRLAATFEATGFVRRILRAGLRDLHPDWPEGRIKAEVAARFLGGG